MRKSILFVCVLLDSTGIYGAQPERTFDEAVVAEGKQFVSVRDALLQERVPNEMLKEKLQAHDWRTRITAAIVLGWKEHGEKYRSLLSSRQLVDGRGNEHFLWASQKTDLTAEVVPLMYELLFKGTGPANAEADAGTVLTFLVRRGVALDESGFVQYVIGDKSGPTGRRKLCATVLAEIPAKQRTAPLDDYVKALQGEPSPDVGSILLGLIAQDASRLPSDRRDAMVGRLAESRELEKLVGKDNIVYAIGGIGGERSSQLVVDYLRRAESSSQKRWALATLGDIGTNQARQTLIEYVGLGELPANVRSTAIAGLGKLKYSDDAGRALKNLVNDRDRPVADRVEAIRAIDRLHKANLNDTDTVPKIEGLLRGLDTKDWKELELKHEFDGAIKRIEGRR